MPRFTGIPLLQRGRAVHGWTLRREHPPAERLADPIRSPTDNHGHARWVTLAEARDLWPRPHPKFGGIVVGEAYAVSDDPAAARRFKPHDPSTGARGGKARS